MDGELPNGLGLDRASLEAAGFEGKTGQTIVLPGIADGPMTVLVGVGDLSDLDADKLRDVGAAFARATQKHGNLALTLGETGSVAPDVAGQVVVEGALLARYRYDVLKGKRTVEPMTELALVVDGRRSAGVRRGAARGVITAEATNIARDLANTPPALLDAMDMAEVATRLGEEAWVEGRDLRQGRH